MLINKMMPSPYKLETEEILLKHEQNKQKGYLHRKHKKNYLVDLNSPNNLNNNNININNHENNDNNNIPNNIKPRKPRKKSNPIIQEVSKDNNNDVIEKRLSRTHKPKIIEDLGYIDKDIIKGKSNPLRRAVSKICERGIIKIKKVPYCGFFYNVSSKSDEPSLNKIEKNIRDFKYQSTYEFIMDLRKVWNHLLKIYDGQIEIKERLFEMCKISEELYCELESSNIEKAEIEEMNKKVDNLEKKLHELKGNSQQFNVPLNLKKSNSNERSMSLNEKTIIKNNIRQLTIEQKKGIVNVLSDTVDTANKKFLEFDIDKLNNKKLKQLDEYVKNCLRKNNLNQNVQKLRDGLSENKNNNSEINNDLLDDDDIQKKIEDSSSESDSNSLSEN